MGLSPLTRIYSASLIPLRRIGVNLRDAPFELVEALIRNEQS